MMQITNTYNPTIKEFQTNLNNLGFMGGDLIKKSELLNYFSAE